MSSTSDLWEVVVLYKDANEWTAGDLEPQPKDVAVALAQRLFERLVIAGEGGVVDVGVRNDAEGDIFQVNHLGEISDEPVARRKL